MSTPNPNQSQNTTAFFVQAALSFGISLFALGLALLFLPVDPWVRAFLAMTSLFLVSSTFTLAKCVRDSQESQSVTTRLDQARVDRILAEHDPFRAVS